MTKSFKDLLVWQEGHKYVLMVYKTTSQFPSNEQFALTNQLRRAVVSVTSNIAEGYGRKQSKDKEHFYVMARGSLDESSSQLEVAYGLGYFNKQQYQELVDQSVVVAKLINGLLRAHKSF